MSRFELPAGIHEYPTVKTAYIRVQQEFPELLDQVRFEPASIKTVYCELEVSMPSPYVAKPGRVEIVFNSEVGSENLECTPAWLGVEHAHVFSWHFASIEETVEKCFELIRQWIAPNGPVFATHKRGDSWVYSWTSDLSKEPHPDSLRIFWPRKLEVGDWVEYSNSDSSVEGRINGPMTLEYDEFLSHAEACRKSS